MSRFFNYFPKTLYTSNNLTAGVDTVTNIIARFGFESTLKNNDNPERHWIVLLFNDIMDPQFDWPLQYQPFIDYVNTKYSANNYADTANTGVTGLAWSMNVNNVQAYYKIVTRTNFDDISIVEKLEVDANTYANVGASTTTYTLQDGSTITQKVTKETKTYYDYEQELNEEKREIKLIKPEFVPQIEKEFKKVIKS